MIITFGISSRTCCSSSVFKSQVFLNAFVRSCFSSCIAHSSSRTSRPAADRIPSSKPFTIAWVSTTAPREVFITMAPRLSFVMFLVLSMCFVSLVNGTWNVMMSDSFRSLSKVVYVKPHSFALAMSGWQSKARTFIPNPLLAMCATALPIFPVPTTPRVLPFRSMPIRPLSSKFPLLVLSTLSIIFLVKASISANVCSATAVSPYPGTLHTVIFLFLQVFRSIWSYPVLIVLTSFTFGIWFRSFLSIGECTNGARMSAFFAVVIPFASRLSTNTSLCFLPSLALMYFFSHGSSSANAIVVINAELGEKVFKFCAGMAQSS